MRRFGAAVPKVSVGPSRCRGIVTPPMSFQVDRAYNGPSPRWGERGRARGRAGGNRRPGCRRPGGRGQSRRDHRQEDRRGRSRGGRRRRGGGPDRPWGGRRGAHGQGRAPAAHRVHLPELLPREAPQPAGRQEADALPGLRLAPLPTALIAAAASAVLLWLALPPADPGPLGLLALIPRLWRLRGRRARRGALLGLVFGLLFYGLLLSWLIPVSILGWAALVLGVGAFLTLFGAVVPIVWRDRAPIVTALSVGAAWALVEWLRGIWPFGGWSWVSLGATQHDNPITLPAATVIGAVGLGFVVAAINALVLVVFLRAGKWRRAVLPAATAAALALLPAVIPTSSPAGPSVDVAGHPGEGAPGIGAPHPGIEDNLVAENHARLHRALAADPPDLVVWPENALDRDPTTDQVIGPVVEEAIVGVGAHTLVGAITRAEDGRLLNQNLLYDGKGEVVDRYAKNHLLPFGEFVPGRRFLDWIPDVRRVRADLSPGTEPGRFRLEELRFASIICFENAFPDLVRDFVTEDEGFLVVSTNNSTFGISAAPEQHVVLSELRAVESGRWVVHAALSGISSFISPRGEVVSDTPLFRSTILRRMEPATSSESSPSANPGSPWSSDPRRAGWPAPISTGSSWRSPDGRTSSWRWIPDRVGVPGLASRDVGGGGAHHVRGTTARSVQDLPGHRRRGLVAGVRVGHPGPAPPPPPTVPG